MKSRIENNKNQGAELLSKAAADLEGLPVLCSVAQAAQVIGLSRASVYRLIKMGRLKVVKIQLTGTTPIIRIPRQNLVLLLEQSSGD